MDKIKNIIIFLCLINISSCDLYSNKPIEYNKNIWNDYDVGMYNESRYNMAIWFLNNNWFNGKTREYILSELSVNYPERDDNFGGLWFNRGKSKEELNSFPFLLYELKYSNDFGERWNIDYYPIPISYLRIFFNENNEIIRAEILYGNKEMENINEFKIKKYWEK